MWQSVMRLLEGALDCFRRNEIAAKAKSFFNIH